MKRHYFYKEGAAPMWIHVPGTPITLPGEQTKYERLPGMTEWAPREVVERMGKGLAGGKSVAELSDTEAQRGLGGGMTTGAAAGGAGGAALARLAGGQKATAPFRDILKRGLNKSSLKGLSKLPGSAKLLPLLGLGLGAAAGAGGWATGRDARQQEARSVGKGLLSEQILQQHSIGQARQGLKRIPIESASMPSPKATVLSSSGV